MFKKMFLVCGIAMVAILSLASFVENSESKGRGGWSCTVTSNCFTMLGNVVVGSVSCTGIETCERGFEWVQCDRKKIPC